MKRYRYDLRPNPGSSWVNHLNEKHDGFSMAWAFGSAACCSACLRRELLDGDADLVNPEDVLSDITSLRHGSLAGSFSGGSGRFARALEDVVAAWQRRGERRLAYLADVLELAATVDSAEARRVRDLVARLTVETSLV